jgi:hypothetical protein
MSQRSEVVDPPPLERVREESRAAPEAPWQLEDVDSYWERQLPLPPHLGDCLELVPGCLQAAPPLLRQRAHKGESIEPSRAVYMSVRRCRPAGVGRSYLSKALDFQPPWCLTH